METRKWRSTERRRRDSSSAVDDAEESTVEAVNLAKQIRPLVVVKAVDLQSKRLRLQTGLLKFFGFHLSDFTICYFSLGFGCIFVLCADHAIYSARRSPASPGVWCSSRIPGNLGEQRLRLTLAATLPTKIYSCVEIHGPNKWPKGKEIVRECWWFRRRLVARSGLPVRGSGISPQLCPIVLLAVAFSHAQSQL